MLRRNSVCMYCFDNFMSGTSVCKIEFQHWYIGIDQSWPGRCRSAFHLVAEGEQSSSSEPRGHNAERWLATQATCSKHFDFNSSTFLLCWMAPVGIWGRSQVSCLRTGCSLPPSACVQSSDPHPWAYSFKHNLPNTYNVVSCKWEKIKRNVIRSLSHLSVEAIPQRVGTIRIDFVFEISFKSSPSEWMWMQERNSIIGCKKERL